MNDNKLAHLIGVYIDNNVWEFLFDKRVYLPKELPRDEFCVCITRAADFEPPTISPERAALKAFVESTIKKCTERASGIDNPKQSELDFAEQQNTPLHEREMMKPQPQEDDGEIPPAARALHSVVLALDTMVGPINDAYRHAGKVVYLSDFCAQAWRLRYFIKSELGMLKLPEH